MYCLWLLVSGAIPVVIDVCLSPFRRNDAWIPTSIAQVLNPSTFSNLMGRTRLSKVESAGGQQQLANSSGRDWLKVTTPEGKTEHVFVKIQSGSFFTNAMMCIFGVYKNELNCVQRGFISAVQPPITTPKIHCARWSPSRFVVIMDDLSRQGVTFPNLWMDPPCSKDLAKEVLSTLARLHAYYLGSPPTGRGGVWDNTSRPYFGKMVGRVAFEKVMRNLPGVVSPHAA